MKASSYCLRIIISSCTQAERKEEAQLRLELQQRVEAVVVLEASLQVTQDQLKDTSAALNDQVCVLFALRISLFLFSLPVSRSLSHSLLLTMICFVHAYRRRLS